MRFVVSQSANAECMSWLNLLCLLMLLVLLHIRYDLRSFQELTVLGYACRAYKTGYASRHLIQRMKLKLLNRTGIKFPCMCTPELDMICL